MEVPSFNVGDSVHMAGRPEPLGTVVDTKELPAGGREPGERATFVLVYVRWDGGSVQKHPDSGLRHAHGQAG